MADDIKPTQDVENTESVLELQELATEAQGEDVEAHGICISWVSIALIEGGPGAEL